MTIEFRLPDLGEDTTGGEVVNLLVQEGDSVEEEQPLIELETDKALLEVPSPAAGKVVKLHVKPGSQISVGELIATIDESSDEEASRAEDKTDEAEPAKKEPSPQPESSEAPEPREKSAAPPDDDEPDDEPGAASKTESPGSKSKTKPSVKKPEADGKDDPDSDEAGDSAEVVEVHGQEPHAPAAPSTRRLARELGVSLSQVTGSGAGGRITKEDVKAFARTSMKPEGAASTGRKGTSDSDTSELPDFSRWGEVERVALSNIRKRTIEALSRSWSEIPHVTQVEEADITDLESLRRRHAKRAAEKGGKLTATVFVIKAVVAAMKEFPEFNASLDLANEELIIKRYFHVGIAVDTEHGLMVPVIRDVDRKHLLDLSAELITLSDRARNRKVKVEDLKGACFTITNLGGLGGTAFTPIINAPEVAILGLARSQKRLFRDDEGDIVERLMLPLCLSYDHRVIDGALAVRFLRKVASMLEDPGLLLLEP